MNYGKYKSISALRKRLAKDGVEFAPKEHYITSLGQTTDYELWKNGDIIGYLTVYNLHHSGLSVSYRFVDENGYLEWKVFHL